MKRAGAVLLLLAAFSLLGYAGLRATSVTVDEFAHLPAAYYYRETGNYYLFDKNPPLVRRIMTLGSAGLPVRVDVASPVEPGGWSPWVFGVDFMERNRDHYLQLFFRARLCVLALGVVLLLLVERWAREAWGPRGGLAALWLAAFEPNLLAHSGLATVDVGCALGFLAAVYGFLAMLRSPTPWRVALAGVALGCAQLTKYTAIVLYPLLVLLAVVHVVRRRAPAAAGAGRSVAATGLAFALSVAIINAGYGFQDSGEIVAARGLQCAPVEGLLRGWPASLPVPLPGPYLQGLDELCLDAASGEFPNYLLGRWSEDGWWYYFPLTLLFKLPLVFLVVVLAATFARRLCRSGEEDAGVACPQEWGIWLPPLLLLALFSSFIRTNYGIRYLLPVLPFLCVYAGRLGLYLPRMRRPARVALLALLCVHPFSAVASSPQFLPFFNLLAGGTSNGHRVLLDSNLDWGQGLPALRRFMSARGIERVGLAYFGHVDPALYGIEWDLPESGISPWVVVSANYLHGYPYPVFRGREMISFPPEQYTWLLGRAPEAILDGALFVYRFPEMPAELTAGRRHWRVEPFR